MARVPSGERGSLLEFITAQEIDFLEVLMFTGCLLSLGLQKLDEVCFLTGLLLQNLSHCPSCRVSEVMEILQERIESQLSNMQLSFWTSLETCGISPTK